MSPRIRFLELKGVTPADFQTESGLLPPTKFSYAYSVSDKVKPVVLIQKKDNTRVMFTVIESEEDRKAVERAGQLAYVFGRGIVYGLSLNRLTVYKYPFEETVSLPREVPGSFSEIDAENEVFLYAIKEDPKRVYVYDARNHSYFVLKVTKNAASVNPVAVRKVGNEYRLLVVVTDNNGKRYLQIYGLSRNSISLLASLPVNSMLYVEKGVREVTVFFENGEAYVASLERGEIRKLNMTKVPDSGKLQQAFYVDPIFVSDDYVFYVAVTRSGAFPTFVYWNNGTDAFETEEYKAEYYIQVLSKTTENGETLYFVYYDPVGVPKPKESYIERTTEPVQYVQTSLLAIEKMQGGDTHEDENGSEEGEKMLTTIETSIDVNKVSRVDGKLAIKVIPTDTGYVYVYIDTNGNVNVVTPTEKKTVEGAVIGYGKPFVVLDKENEITVTTLDGKTVVSIEKGDATHSVSAFDGRVFHLAVENGTAVVEVYNENGEKISTVKFSLPGNAQLFTAYREKAYVKTVDADKYHLVEINSENKKTRVYTFKNDFILTRSKDGLLIQEITGENCDNVYVLKEKLYRIPNEAVCVNSENGTYVASLQDNVLLTVDTSNKKVTGVYYINGEKKTDAMTVDDLVVSNGTVVVLRNGKLEVVEVKSEKPVDDFLTAVKAEEVEEDSETEKRLGTEESPTQTEKPEESGGVETQSKPEESHTQTEKPESSVQTEKKETIVDKVKEYAEKNKTLVMGALALVVLLLALAVVRRRKK